MKTFLVSACLLIVLITACKPDVERIKVIYPNHNFFIGQSLKDFRNSCKCHLEEADNDAGSIGERFFNLRDTLNGSIHSYVFAVFYKEVLVAFHSKYHPIDSSKNIQDWVNHIYSSIISSHKISKSESSSGVIYKNKNGNSYSLLQISEDYKKSPFVNYIVGDYRYKEKDWE